MEKQKYNALHAGLLAVLIGVIIMLPAAFMYNGMFMIRGDYTHQTVTRLITAKNMLSSGSAQLWNWNNFLGTAYNGAYSTLLSFSAVCMLFPVKLMPYAAMLSLCIRWFVMGVSSYALLRRFVNSHRTALVGVLLYCFSGYVMACLEFAAFYNTMAVFPLMLLALEKRFTDERYRYLLIPVTIVNFIASTYLFIGSSVAMLVYALARFFTAEEWKKNRKFGYILLCLAEYFIGVMICGFTLFTFAGTMFSTSRATSSLAANGISKGSFARLIIPKYFFDELAGIFMPAASNRVTTFFSYNKWYSMQAYLPMFGFSLCFAHILKRGIKDSISIAAAALLLFSIIPLLNNITSFYANSYTRWWYALTLVMSIATIRMLHEIDQAAEPIAKPGAHVKSGLVLQWAVIIAIPALFYVVRYFSGTSSVAVKRVIALFFNHDYSFGFAEDIFRIFSIVWAVVFTTALSLVLFNKKVRRHTLTLLAVLIALYGMSFVLLNNSDAPVFDALLNGRTDDSPVRTQKAIVSRYYIDEKPVDNGPYTYRIDHSGEVINYAAAVDMPSISYFESTVDTDSARFAEFSGMGKADSVLFVPPDNGNALRTLLSVKYYYDLFDDGRQNEIPEGFVPSGEIGSIKVYENTNYLPFGYAYDSYMTESELYAMDGATIETLLHTLVVADEDEARVKQYLPHCEDASHELAADISARKRLTSTSFEGDPAGFTAEFDAQKNEVVFFSVPYSEGWQADIDGSRTEFVRAGIGFMAVMVPEGRHTVTFTYHNRTVLPGAICSGCGLAVAAGYIAVSEAKRKKRRSSTEEA